MSDEIDASGLFTSWATPAARVPIEASFSVRINCSLRRCNSSMSDAIFRLIFVEGIRQYANLVVAFAKVHLGPVPAFCDLDGGQRNSLQRPRNRAKN